MEAPGTGDSNLRVSSTLKKCERCGMNDFLYENYSFMKPVPGVGLMEFIGEICGICRTELHHRTYTAGA